MAEELRCPECNKDMIKTRYQIVNRATNKPSRTWLVFLGGGAAVLVGLLLLLGGVASMQRGDPGMFIFGAVAGLLFIAPAVLAFYNTFSSARVEVAQHQCYACGHAWETRADSAWVPQECPECGSAHVQGQGQERVVAGTETQIGMGSVLAGLFFGGLGIPLLISGLGLALSASDAAPLIHTFFGMEVSEQTAGLLYAGIGFFLVLGSLGQIISYVKADFFAHLVCDDCGHYWTAREG